MARYGNAAVAVSSDGKVSICTSSCTSSANWGEIQGTGAGGSPGALAWTGVAITGGSKLFAIANDVWYTGAYNV